MAFLQDTLTPKGQDELTCLCDFLGDLGRRNPSPLTRPGPPTHSAPERHIVLHLCLCLLVHMSGHISVCMYVSVFVNMCLSVYIQCPCAKLNVSSCLPTSLALRP